MINLQLLFPKSQPMAADAAAIATAATTLNVQPAPGAAAPTAPSDPFPRTSAPGADLEAVRAGIRNVVETTVVDLSVARSIAAGTALILPIQGTAYFVDKGADVGLATIHIQDQAVPPANSISTFPGDANNNLAFTFWVIENIAQAGKVLRIHYGTGIQFLPGLGGNITFTGGVSILQTSAGSPQGGDLATSSGNAFGVFNGAAGGANFAFAGIFNPGASGKRVYVDAIIWFTTAAAGNQVAFRLTNTSPGVDGGTGFSRLNAGAASVSHTRGGNVVTTGQSVDQDSSNAANVPQRRILTRPFVLDQGFGLLVQSQVAANDVNASFEFREY